MRLFRTYCKALNLNVDSLHHQVFSVLESFFNIFFFQKKCETSDNGLRSCTISCRNNANIEPLMKRKVKVFCKCIWGRDKDGFCHWRYGARVVDNPDWTKFFYGQWSCGETLKPTKPPKGHKKQISTTTASETTTSVDDTKVYRIPQKLVCPVSVDRNVVSHL